MPPKCFNKMVYFRMRRKTGNGKLDAALGQTKQNGIFLGRINAKQAQAGNRANRLAGT